MILARNPNFVGSCYGINCYQIVFPNLSMAMGLHVSYKPRKLNNNCGCYEFFRQNRRISEDFQNKPKWGQKVEVFKWLSFLQFYIFCPPAPLGDALQEGGGQLTVLPSLALPR